MKAIFTTATVGALAILASIGTVNAADLYESAPAPAYAPVSAYDWSGFYAGINGGLGGGTSAADTGYNVTLSGGLIGGQIGYNFQFTQNWVWGAEADLDWANIGGTNTSGPTVTQTLNTLGTVRGRIGYAMGNVMPYFTAGFAWGSATRTSTLGSSVQSLTHSGYAIGGGIEYAFTPHLSGKLEYLYAGLGARTYTAIPANPAVTMNVSTFRVGANYHF